MKDIDVRKYIINNFKEDTIEDIEKSIVESIESKEDDPLIGLGVLFEIMWNNSDSVLRNSILMNIKKGLDICGQIVIWGGLLISVIMLMFGIETNNSLSSYDSVGISNVTIFLYFVVCAFASVVFGFMLMGLAKLIDNQEKLIELSKQSSRGKNITKGIGENVQ